MAHSGDCVLLAWSIGSPVGVDVESVNRGASFADLADAAFSPEERDILSSAPPDETAILFYSIWVRKEAVLKAEGRGIAGGLQSFSVASPSVEWPKTIQYPGTMRIWQLLDLQPAPGHLGAIAFPENTRVDSVSPPELR